MCVDQQEFFCPAVFVPGSSQVKLPRHLHLLLVITRKYTFTNAVVSFITVKIHSFLITESTFIFVLYKFIKHLCIFIDEHVH